MEEILKFIADRKHHAGGTVADRIVYRRFLVRTWHRHYKMVSHLVSTVDGLPFCSPPELKLAGGGALWRTARQGLPIDEVLGKAITVVSALAVSVSGMRSDKSLPISLLALWQSFGKVCIFLHAASFQIPPTH